MRIGLISIAAAAKQITYDGMNIAVSSGVESVSLVQNKYANTYRAHDEWLVEHKPSLYLGMLETVEIVAERRGISRAQQDAYALQSQQRTATAQASGRFGPLAHQQQAQRVTAPLHMPSGFVSGQTDDGCQPAAVPGKLSPGQWRYLRPYERF